MNAAGSVDTSQPFRLVTLTSPGPTSAWSPPAATQLPSLSQQQRHDTPTDCGQSGQSNHARLSAWAAASGSGMVIARQGTGILIANRPGLASQLDRRD